jgi:hypothetical protein
MAKVTVGGRTYDVEVRGEAVVVDGNEYPVKVREENGYSTVTAGGVGYRVQLPPTDQRQSPLNAQVDYRPFTFEFEGRLGGGASPRPVKEAAAGVPAPRAAAKGGVAARSRAAMTVKVKPATP